VLSKYLVGHWRSHNLYYNPKFNWFLHLRQNLQKIKNIAFVWNSQPYSYGYTTSWLTSKQIFNIIYYLRCNLYLIYHSTITKLASEDFSKLDLTIIKCWMIKIKYYDIQQNSKYSCDTAATLKAKFRNVVLPDN